MKFKSYIKRLLFTPGYFSSFRIQSDAGVKPYFGFIRAKVGGPVVRTERMIEAFGNSRYFPNLIYGQSWWTNEELDTAIEYCKKKGIPFIFNQNGWYYSGWYKGDFNYQNEFLARIHAKADFVIFQSKFCMDAGKALVGLEPKENTILYNAVPSVYPRTKHKNKIGRQIIVLSGVFTPDAEHIISPALKAIRLLGKGVSSKYSPKLIIAGYFPKITKETLWYDRIINEIKALQDDELCTLLGQYDYKIMHELFSKADIALHLKYKDPCPNAVVERMKIGLGHIYSNSGGTPELIGDAGIGIEVRDVWDEQVPVDSEILAEAIERGLYYSSDLSDAAWERSKYFSWEKYINDHRNIFVHHINKFSM